MIETVIRKDERGFEWINIIEPSLRELAQVAMQYDLHSTSVHDCLDPEHLPKYENINNVSFIVARSYDASSPERADTIRKLTNKIAIFWGKDFLITIQRSDHEYLRIIRNKWRVSKDEENMGFQIIVDIYRALINSYEPPVNQAIEALDRYEEEIFADTTPTSIIESMYLLRRRAMVYRRLLFLTNEIFAKIADVHLQEKTPFFHDVADKANEMYYYADQLLISANDLLNIYISLASHRTNEVMKVLTISSVFFLPLTFIVGVYGMNFEIMPELKFKYGYYMAWISMALIVLGIYLVLRQKGWLRS